MQEWVDRLDAMAVDVNDHMLRETGFVQQPTVHLLLDELAPPYLGYVTCRQFHRGEDAARAVAGLGLFGSMFGASRVVATWEYCDLAVALEKPDAHAAPLGVVVLDATRSGHTVRWHPMRLHAGPVVGGVPTGIPEWGEPRRHERGDLPGPVEALLNVWRMPNPMSDQEIAEACKAMEEGGYKVRFPAREPETPRPGWMRLLVGDPG